MSNHAFKHARCSALLLWQISKQPQDQTGLDPIQVFISVMIYFHQTLFLYLVVLRFDYNLDFGSGWS